MFYLSSQDLIRRFEETLKILSEKELRFNDDTSEQQEDELEVPKTWIEVFRSEERIYSSISKEIFEADTNVQEEDIVILMFNIEQLKDYRISEDFRENARWKKFIFKILDHLKLARQQKQSMSESIRIAQQAMGNVNQVVEDLNKQRKDMDKTLKKIDKLNQKSKNIQKEFIAILGIFASILIAAFGGLTSLGSLFGKINEVATYKLVFLGSFEVLSILMILFLMLNGVAKLTGLNLRSCGCKENEKCECKIHKKHPTLFMLTILIILLAFISTAPILNGFISNWNSNNSNITTLILYSVMIVISIIIIVCSWNFIHNKKDVEEAPPNQ